MNIEAVLEKKVNGLYDFEVTELADELTNKIEKKKTKLQGYESSIIFLNKSEVIDIFNKYASCSNNSFHSLQSRVCNVHKELSIPCVTSFLTTLGAPAPHV